MARNNRNCKFITLVWEKMNYKQKLGIYHFTTDDKSVPSERLLNLWWFSLCLDERLEIMNTVMEFLNAD